MQNPNLVYCNGAVKKILSIADLPDPSDAEPGAMYSIAPADGTFRIDAKLIGVGAGAYWHSIGHSAALSDRPNAASFGRGYWTVGDDRVSYSDGVNWYDTPIIGSAMISGEWYAIPSLFRLEMSGTGTIVLDSADSLGQITLSVFTVTVSEATNDIGFPYPGDSAVSIRASYTGTANARII